MFCAIVFNVCNISGSDEYTFFNALNSSFEKNPGCPAFAAISPYRFCHCCCSAPKVSPEIVAVLIPSLFRFYDNEIWSASCPEAAAICPVEEFIATGMF